MPEVSCEFHYDSAHWLPAVGEGHKCGRLHGHTYRLTVTVSGDIGEVSGWIIDFADVAAAVTPLVDKLDHHYLNEVIPNPTVENQLIWLWNRLAPVLPGLRNLTLAEGLSNVGRYP
jgi:6-pyruvoyltetrahydropterin/6-carboxytetrahydropterin synthase